VVTCYCASCSRHHGRRTDEKYRGNYETSVLGPFEDGSPQNAAVPLWTTSKYGLKPLIDCPNLQSTTVRGTHRVSSGVLEHGLDVRAEMPIRSKRAEVCTEAAILY
jgi:hypothetical protein